MWARIEVLNLDTGDRAEVLLTGANTNPRAIAVDPTTRYILIPAHRFDHVYIPSTAFNVCRFMYWTELGENVGIERAYMDGSFRHILVPGIGLLQPNGLTIDIAEQRVYWCDTSIGTIRYADINPAGLQDITELTLDSSIIVQPFALTLSETSVFWTDWSTNSIYSTHKLHGNGESNGHFSTVYTSSVGTPRGLEVVASSQQPTGR